MSSPDITEDSIQTLTLLAHVYLEHNMPEKAIVLLRALESLQLSTPHHLRMLAIAQLHASKPADTLASTERLALLGQVDAAFHLIRAQALTALDRSTEAQAAMQAFMQQQAKDKPFPLEATP